MSKVQLKCNQCDKKKLVELPYFYQEMLAHHVLACSGRYCPGNFTLQSKSGSKKLTEYKFAAEMQAKKEAGVIGGRNKLRDPDYYKKIEQAYEGLSDVDDDDETTDPDHKEVKEFNPAMRYTQQSMSERSMFAACTFSKVKTLKISNSAGRGVTSTVMGGAAWKLAKNNGAPNAGKYRLGGKDHYEWCHLVADSLGGPTSKDNLVAAHYAVNTYMLAIEGVLNSRDRQDLTVTVTAYCNIEHIADHIDYQIFNLRDKELFKVTIDGHIKHFSKDDYQFVQTKVRASIGS